jgi:hypothetical protein
MNCRPLATSLLLLPLATNSTQQWICSIAAHWVLMRMLWSVGEGEELNGDLELMQSGSHQANKTVDRQLTPVI